MPSIILRVVPLTLEVIAIFLSSIELSSVLLPTLGLPTILTKPVFILNHPLQMEMGINR